ncbi:hypothetical protein N8Z47_02040 [Salibacteraceae bacterium]|nr:hypothetical protein [Salibacteraceae bacterium]
MSESIENNAILTLSEEEQAVLKTVLFFDAFDYPLKPSEVHQYAPISMSPLNVLPCLNFMVNHALLFQHGSFFSSSKDAAIGKRRQDANAAAESKLKVARRFASLISRFPFVRSIAITGNLTRGFVMAEDDLEFFIIAKSGRLWLTRAMLQGFRKVFLLNNKHYFNMNYFLDEAQLEVPDKNLFTATQLKTLIPAYNAELFVRFVDANKWTSEFLPNIKPIKVDALSPVSTYPIKATLEMLLNITFGAILNKSYKRSSLSVWKKEKDLSQSAEAILEVGSYISIPLVEKKQQNILEAYSSKSEAFKSQNETNFS